MAATLIQTSPALRTAGSGATATLSFSAPVTAGSKLILVVANYPSGLSSVTDTRGNSWTKAVAQGDDGDNYVEIWYADNAVAGSTTMTLTSAVSSDVYLSGMAMEWSGVAAGAPTGKGSASQPPAIATSVTVSTAEALTSGPHLIVTGAVAEGGTEDFGWAAPSGYTRIDVQFDSWNYTGYQAAYRVAAVSGVQSATHGYGDYWPADAVIAAWPEAASGPATRSATASMAAIVQQRRQTTSGLGAAVAAPRGATVGLQAALSRQRGADASLAAAVQALVAKVAGVQVAVQAARSSSSLVDGAVRRLGSLSADLDAVLTQARTASALLEARVLGTRQVTTLLDVQVQGGSQVSASLSAALQQLLAAAADVDVVVLLPSRAQAAVDAAVRGGRSAGAGLASAVQLPRGAGAQLDLALQRLATLSAELSLVLAQLREAGASLDVQVQAGTSASASIDAAILVALQAAAGVQVAVLQARSAGATVAAAVAVQGVLQAAMSAGVEERQRLSAALGVYVMSPGGQEGRTGDVTVSAVGGIALQAEQQRLCIEVRGGVSLEVDLMP